jgi:Flagellar biosynthesis/type III secretory pathway lipoprotein
VTIVIPETRLFLEQQMPSTASVMLRIAPGREIGQEEVKAIVHLVASSIEGLKPENVTIVDTDGQNLTDLVSDGSLLFTDSGGGSGGRRDVTSVKGV